MRYRRGARASVWGRSGVVLRIYTAHSHTMLEVDFETEVYPCWVENVDLEVAARPASEGFSDVEITTFV